MHLEDAVAALRPDPFDAMTETRQPRGQRIGAEMTLDDQRRNRIGFQAADPGEQQLVEPLLAEPDRRVGVHGGEPDAAWDRVRLGGDDIARACTLGVARAEVERAAVDIHCPDPRVRVAERHGDGDRAVSAADVDDLARRDRRAGFGAGDRYRVEVTVREDAAVGVELEGPVRERHPDRPRTRGDLRIGLK